MRLAACRDVFLQIKQMIICSFSTETFACLINNTYFTEWTLLVPTYHSKFNNKPKYDNNSGKHMKSKMLTNKTERNLIPTHIREYQFRECNIV